MVWCTNVKEKPLESFWLVDLKMEGSFLLQFQHAATLSFK